MNQAEPILVLMLPGLSAARLRIFATVLISDGSPTAWLIGGILALMGLVILAPLIFRAFDEKFFSVPYVTWYLLHDSVAVLAILAILILGLAGVLPAAVISALLGSLLGYVLGTRPQRASGREASASDGESAVDGSDG